MDKVQKHDNTKQLVQRIILLAKYIRILFKDIRFIIIIIIIIIIIGARGSVVAKTLCYKPEGRGFDSR
jgi:hypothetical protein